MKNDRIAIYVDLANMEAYNLREILTQLRQEGRVEVLLCYGDFQQAHIRDMALEIYALGFTMVNCPSQYHGNDVVKRSDDGLMVKGIRDTLAHRPKISTYALVTSDADIIPACQSIAEHGKRIVLYSDPGALGGLLRLCGFEVRQVSKRSNGHHPDQFSDCDNTEVIGNTKTEQHNGDYSIEKIIREIDRMEQNSRFLTFMTTVGKIAKGDAVLKEKLQQHVSDLIKDGVIESYKHQISAIRLNRGHTLVTSTLDPFKEKVKAVDNRALVM